MSRYSTLSCGRTSVYKKLGLLSLILGAAGLLVDNVAVVRFQGLFVFSLVYVLEILAILAFLFEHGPKLRNIPVFIAWLAMVSTEVFRGLVTENLLEIEWLSSFALFLFSTTGFLFLSGFTIKREDLQAILPWFSTLSILFSAFAVLQSVLGNLFDVFVSLPVRWQVNPWFTTNWQSFRVNYGIVRASGIASEPSYYGMGLAVLLALCLFFDRLRLFQQRWECNVIFFSLLAGILVTLSMGALITVCAILLPFLFRRRRLAIQLLSITVICGVLLLTTSSLVQQIGERMTSRVDRILTGEDRSAIVRVIQPIEILFMPSPNMIDGLLGTGVGRQAEDGRIIDISAKYVGDLKTWKVVNILTLIRVLQGYLGLLIFFGAVFAILRPWKRHTLPDGVLLIMLVMFLFATGLYLPPTLWCLMALIAAFRKSELYLLPEKSAFW